MIQFLLIFTKAWLIVRINTPFQTDLGLFMLNSQITPLRDAGQGEQEVWMDTFAFQREVSQRERLSVSGCAWEGRGERARGK